MREFGSGILGCIICVVALMGSILGGFVLDVDAETRETTNYNYITDISGLFNTDRTPQYVEYNPSTNFTGYSEQTVNFVNSGVPNAYRYVVDSGLVRTINTTSSGMTASMDHSTMAHFNMGNFYRPYLIDYTGTAYNFGSDKDFYGCTYNLAVNNISNGKPCVTTLYEMFTASGHTNLTGLFELINTANPVILYPGTSSTNPFTAHAGSPTVPLSGNMYYNSLQVNDSNFPSRIQIGDNNNIINVTAYDSSNNVLWTSNVYSVYVIYDYTFERNSSTIHNVHTDFLKRLDIDFTTVKNDGTYSGSWQPTSSTKTTSDTNGVLYYYDGSLFNFGSSITINGYDAAGYSQTGGKANIFAKTNSGYYTATSFETIWNMANILNTSYVYFSNITIELTDLGYYPILVTQGGGTQWYDANQNPTYTMMGGSRTGYSNDQLLTIRKLVITDDPDNSNRSYAYIYDKNGTLISTTHPTHLNIMDTIRGLYLCFAYSTVDNPSDMIPSFQIDVHATYREGPGGIQIGAGTNSDYTTAAIATPSIPHSPLVALDYNGTEYAAIFGSDLTGFGRTYNAVLSMVTTGSPYEPPDYYWHVFSLSDMFDNLDTDNNAIDITLNITHNEVPCFIVRGNNWDTSAYYAPNGSYLYTYVRSVDDNNIPTRLVWNGQSNWVSVYKNGTLLYSDNAENVYMITSISTVNSYQDRATLDGIMNVSGTPLTSITVDESSSYDYSTKWFTPVNTTPSYNQHYLINAYINYTGNAYASSFGTRAEGNIRLQNTTTTDNKDVPYVTTLDKILSGDYSNYSKVTLNINYGTFPIFIYNGGWTYSHSEETIRDYEHGYDVTYTSYRYFATMGDTSLPTKLEIIPNTGTVNAYRNNALLWTNQLSEICVIWQYDGAATGSTPTWTEATTQSATFSGEGIPNPVYAYMDPTKGGVLNTATTNWSNGYDNNTIDITLAKVNNSPNELTITAGNSSITVRIQNSTMTAYLTNYDGTTATKTIGAWGACQIEINAAEGTVSLTPLSSPISYTNRVPTDSTTITWTGWYQGGDITSLVMSSNVQSMRFSVTNTSVFLNTYGIVMQDPSININNYFPEYESWRLNFYSFALVGDSMTVNDQTFDIDADQKITLSREGEKTISGTLSNIYVTEANNHTYFTFADSKESIDLGETTSENISFNGLWYFTTGLYEGVEGVEEYYDWNLDGQYHATLTQTCLMFLGLMVIGIIVCRVMFHLSFASMNGIILISAAVLALIIAGGTL